jgi:uncharacterized membrane protein
MIGEVPIFALMDDEEREVLSRMMDTRNFKQGETIFEYGDQGGEIFIVREGRVEVYLENTDGQKIVVGDNERGDVLGELSFLDGGCRSASARAVEDTQTLTMDRDRLLEFINKHPHAALDLLTVVGRRLRSTNELLRTQVTRNVNEEVEETLTFGERIADKVAAFGGSWTFILLFGAIMFVWVVLNTSALLRNHFDPYPYILLNLVLSMLAAMQAPIIMMSQNRQSSKDRIQSDMDYQVNLKAELEVAHLHHKLDRMHERLETQFAKMEGQNNPDHH